MAPAGVHETATAFAKEKEEKRSALAALKAAAAATRFCLPPAG